MPVRSIPEGYSSVTPHLIVSRGAEAIEFYMRAFDAEVLMRFDGPDGNVAHAELQIGDSRIMLADENPEMGFRSPQSLGGSGTSLMLYVDNVDTVFAHALEAGAKGLREVQNQFYGDRSGNLVDPFGHLWTIATHVEDVSPDEMQRRMEATMGVPATK